MKGNLVFTATTLRKIALLGILSLSLIACGKAKSGEGSSAGSQAATKQESDGTAKQEENGSTDQKAENKDNKKIPLRVIANNNNVAHIDSVIAQYAGLYDKNGLDTTIQFNPSNPDNIQALLADKADLVSAGSSAVLNYIDNGSDIVIIGGQMSLGETVYVRPERAEEFKDLYNPNTLYGKKVGVTRLNTGDVAFRKILKDKGLDLSKIEFVELDSQATVTQAVLKGDVDLGINFLTFRDGAEKQGLVPVSQLDAEDEWPDYICCRLFTTRDKLKANREAYVDALKANIEAYSLLENDKEAAEKAARQGIDLDDDAYQKQVYQYGHLGLSPNPDRQNTKAFFQAMVDIGYSKGNVNIDDYIDTTFFEDALNELIKENPDNKTYQALKAESESTNQ